MKKITYFLTSLLLLVLFSCQSDDAGTVDTEEMTYLKNEWNATERGVSSGKLSDLSQDEFFVTFRPLEESLFLKIGMNKDNIFYFINGIKRYSESVLGPIEVKFGCVQNNGSLFTGKLYPLAGADFQEETFKVTIIDDHTIVVIFAVPLKHDNKDKQDCTFFHYKFEKTGSWDELTNVRSIFKDLGYEEEWLDERIGSKYEAERSNGSCFSKI